MAKLRSRKDVDLLYKKAQLLSSPKILNYASQVAMRSRLGGLRSGYINRLNRLEKQSVPQMKGIPGCGMNVKDWLIDEDN